MPDRDPKLSPFTGLAQLISDEQLSVDILMCCGDITDKGHPAALRYGWRALEALKGRLGAILTVATVGNHDIDSRYEYSEYDARGAVLDLAEPLFPVNDAHLANEYWARNFCVLEAGNYRLVLLNSAAYHGTARADAPAVSGRVAEYFHGRVSSRTVARLNEYLSQAAPKNLNILLCHHHPARLDALAHLDPSEMLGGQMLIDALSEPDRGRWLIVHGHRHVARIQRPGGAALNAGCLVFCAGSFGKVLPPAWPSSNQFYVLELHTDPRQAHGLGMAGEFRAWSWTRGQGWQRAGFRENLPGRGGFGFLGEMADLASAISTAMDASGQGFVRFDEAVRDVPHLRFVAPGDWPHLLRELKARNVRVLEDPDDGEVLFAWSAAP